MLALWEYFWVEADWTPAPPPPSTPVGVTHKQLRDWRGEGNNNTND